MRSRIKNILFLLIMVMLFLPLIQQTFHFTQIRKLYGDYQPAPDTPITLQGWLSGKYQIKKEKYLHDHFGYHHVLIRIHNQLAFDIFNKAKANGVIIGKKNFLYEHRYIEAYYGSDFLGFDSIRKKIEMIRYVEDTLKKLNKNLIIVFAPGKGAYYPEYIPDDKKLVTGVPNIQYYQRYAQQYGITHIDFHSWFIQQKKKTRYPLIPRYGIHWSDYGASLAADSLITFIEKLRGIDMPDIYWDQIKEEPMHPNDQDIELGMNLLYKFPPEIMGYPDILIEEPGGKTRPSVLVIADSYYWQLYNMGINRCFDKTQFWYYNRSVHVPSDMKAHEKSEVNLHQVIQDHDVIIVLGSDIALPDFGWGIIEEMFHYFNGTDGKLKTISTISPVNALQKIKDDIKKDEAWMKSIRIKATQMEISVDSMLTLDAIWCLEKQTQEKKY